MGNNKDTIIKFMKYIDIVDGKPVILDNPIEVEIDLSIPTLKYSHDSRIYELYSDYLTDEENKKVYLTADGITVNNGKDIYCFHQGSKSAKECADIIKDLLKIQDGIENM